MMRVSIHLFALLSICWLLIGCEAGYMGDIAAPAPSGEAYNEIVENPFVNVADEPTSTFSVDADGGAYSNVRRLIQQGALPPAEAVRTEEFINYFPYDYPSPSDGEAIALNGEISQCPWAPSHQLIRIGIKGESLTPFPPSNFVLLLDVSGSMSEEIELMKEALYLLVDQFTAQDRIAIVTYAGASEVALASTRGDEKQTIRRAIRRLKAGGFTAGAEGIITAYEIAQEHFIADGNNRVLLATDGDFNVGVSSQEELIALIEEKRESGVFLTTIGLGSGNYQEGQMEQLANHGNGTYEYLDDLTQAKKLFVHEFSKLYTVAKDVKVQVTFNPNRVKAYRLIGYENRVLNNDDFDNDSTDAGEIGADQTITALYEIVPHLDPATKDENSFEVLFRYKFPQAASSRGLTLAISDQPVAFEQASENLRWAAAVASFALLLRDSDYRGDATYPQIRTWMQAARQFDPHGYRAAAIELVEEVEGL